MKPENMSCIDCTVKNCDRMDKAYPEFCPTVHMDQDVYQEAMECYKEEGNHKVMTAAAEVEYTASIHGSRRSWTSRRGSERKK